MNNRYLLILAFYLLSTNIQAQEDDQKFHFGIKLAPSISFLKPDSKGLDNGGSKLGFSYGIITEFKIQNNYAFVTGLQANYRNGKIEYVEDVTGIKKTVVKNLEYVEIPVLLKMKTNPFDKYKYFAQVGFVNGYNIRAKDEEKNDISGEISKLMFAMSISLGAEYSISGSTVVVASIEYNNGLTNVLKGKSDIPELKAKNAKSNYFALNIGILF